MKRLLAAALLLLPGCAEPMAACDAKAWDTDWWYVFVDGDPGPDWVNATDWPNMTALWLLFQEPADYMPVRYQGTDMEHDHIIATMRDATLRCGGPGQGFTIVGQDGPEMRHVFDDFRERRIAIEEEHGRQPALIAFAHGWYDVAFAYQYENHQHKPVNQAGHAPSLDLQP